MAIFAEGGGGVVNYLQGAIPALYGVAHLKIFGVGQV